MQLANILFANYATNHGTSCKLCNYYKFNPKKGIAISSITIPKT
jgi:hypothetical protein